jgi:hypothetical protein
VPTVAAAAAVGAVLTEEVAVAEEEPYFELLSVLKVL